MKITSLVCLFLTGCMHAEMVNYPGKDLPDRNAPITDPSKPGAVTFRIRAAISLEGRRADAYELMHEACQSTRYTILKECKDPDHSKMWLITFKCD